MAENARRRLRFARAALSVVLLLGTTLVLTAAALPALRGESLAERKPFDLLLAARDRICLALGEDSIGGVYVTSERLLPKITEYDAAALEENANRVVALSDRAETPVYVLAVPTAAAIYSSDLPRNAPRLDEREILRNFEQKLQMHDVRVIESYSWLSAAREQYLYYRTDSRLTSYGAYILYRTAIQKLSLKPVGYDRFEIAHFDTEYYGDLARKTANPILARPDTVDLYTTADSPEITRVTALREDGTRETLKDYFQPADAERSGSALDVFAAMTRASVTIETDSPGGMSLTLLTDANGAAIVPFLYNHYTSLTVVNVERADEAVISDALDAGANQILLLCGIETLLGINHAE